MRLPRCAAGAALALAACATEPSAEPQDLSTPGRRPALAAVSSYFPPPESGGGWRRLVAPNTTPTAQQKSDIRTLAGLDWDILRQAWDASSQYGGSFLVIWHGYIGAEGGSHRPLLLGFCNQKPTAPGVDRIFQ